MPMRSASSPHLLAALGLANATRGANPAQLCFAAGSLLTFSFNALWTGALNGRKTHGFTHFAMLHDDVLPCSGWLDVLMDELERTGADVVSAVVPIKDDRGLTSTARDSTGDVWLPRRLTMTEIWDGPETFTYPDLLVNTGCWVCPLDRPWCEQVVFRQRDRILCMSNGEFVAQTMPEDWDFSRQVKAHGGALYATRKVRLEHERPEFTNTRPWGRLKTDDENVPQVEMRELSR